jgi:hypothetical protein
VCKGKLGQTHPEWFCLCCGRDINSIVSQLISHQLVKGTIFLLNKAALTRSLYFLEIVCGGVKVSKGSTMDLSKGVFGFDFLYVTLV